MKKTTINVPDFFTEVASGEEFCVTDNRRNAVFFTEVACRERFCEESPPKTVKIFHRSSLYEGVLWRNE